MLKIQVEVHLPKVNRGITSVSRFMVPCPIVNDASRVGCIYSIFLPDCFWTLNRSLSVI